MLYAGQARSAGEAADKSCGGGSIQQVRALLRMHRALTECYEELSNAGLTDGRSKRIEIEYERLIGLLYESIMEVGWRMARAKSGLPCDIRHCAEVLLFLCDRDDRDVCSALTVALCESLAELPEPKAMYAS